MNGFRFLCFIFQAARLLYCYANPADKIRVLRILEPVRETFILILFMKPYSILYLFHFGGIFQQNLILINYEVMYCFVFLQRLCQMTCREGRDIINAVSIHNDKLIALDCIKR